MDFVATSNGANERQAERREEARKMLDPHTPTSELRAIAWSAFKAAMDRQHSEWLRSLTRGMAT